MHRRETILKLYAQRCLILSITVEHAITLVTGVIALLLLIFAVDWRYFRDWVVVFLFKCVLDLAWSSPVVKLGLIAYPDRLLPRYYDTCVFFELWIFPILCVLYNQVTRERGLFPIIGYALLFSASMTALESLLEKYTNLIKYFDWTWFTTFYTLTLTFLSSRTFIALYRRGCNHFGEK